MAQRSGTLVGHAPPNATASADATGIRTVQSPVVAPAPDPALAATVPAVSAAPVQRHPATLDLIEHSADSFAKLTPAQIRALLTMTSEQWSGCTWRILTELKGEQRSAVPAAFYRAMADQLIARRSPGEFDEVPRWIINGAGMMTEPRHRTMAEIAGESQRRGRIFKVMVVVVSVVFLVGLWLILKMIGWL